MLIIGSHVSFGNNQLLGATQEAISYNANTFMFYTGAPTNTIRKDIDENITNKAIELMEKNNIDINNVICHAPYIVNLANKLIYYPRPYQFGFSYVGLIFLLMLFIPNFFWTKNVPKGYKEYADRENKILLVLERMGEVMVTTIVICFKDIV